MPKLITFQIIGKRSNTENRFPQRKYYRLNALLLPVEEESDIYVGLLLLILYNNKHDVKNLDVHEEQVSKFRIRLLLH